MKRNILLATSGFAAIVLASGQAAAQSLEEVVVTAQKRVENVQDIPKQVQVVGVETLRRNNVTSVLELGKLVPSISGAGRNGDAVSMRGVGSNASSIGANGKVGIVLDDVPVPSRASFVNNLLDIERVEVLPGPQGTLAGRNAAGGLINMVTRAPSTSGYVGRASLLATSDREYQGGVYVSGPISDQVSFSASQQYSKFRGLMYNVVDGKWASNWNATTRLKVAYSPDDTLTLTGTGFYYTAKQNQTGTVYRELLFPATSYIATFDVRTPRRTFADLYPGIVVSPDSRGFYRAPGRKVQQLTNTVGAIGRLEKTFGDNTLTVVASALKERRPAATDSMPYDLTDMNVRPEWLAHGNGAAQQRNVTDYKTFEARINNASDAKVSYVAGVFASRNLNEYDYIRYFRPVEWYRDFYQNSAAAYGNLAYTFDTGTTIRGGLRYEADTVKYRWDFAPILATSYRSANGTLLTFPEVNKAVTSKGSSDASFLNYDIGIQHKFNDDVMVYATHARANQGPLYDAEDNTVAIVRELPPIPPEIAKNFEAGFKSQWFNRRMTFNANVFRTTFDNYQVNTTTIDNTNPNAVPILKLNAVGGVLTKGVEGTLSALLFDGFSVNANASYTDAKITEFPYAPCYTNQTAATGCITAVVPGETTARPYQRDLAGKTLPAVPKYSLNLTATYRHNLTGDTDFEISSTGRYRSKQNTDILGNPASDLPSTTFVNASAALLHKEHRVELFVNNLFKESAETFGTWVPTGLSAPAAGVTVRTRVLNRDNFRYWGIRYSGAF